MGTASRCGVLVFSVELECRSDQTAFGPHFGLASLVRRLVQQLDRYRMPATWAVSEPVDSGVLAQVTSSHVGHEIAILGDGSWIGSGVSRATAARELDRRILAARQRSLTVSSLVLRDTELGDQYDLLRNRGITAVRGSRPASGRRPLHPGPRRSRIWFQSPDVTVPGGALAWFSGGDVRRARTVIRRALQCGAASHVAIRANRLVRHERSGLRKLEGILNDVQQWRQSGGLLVKTFAEADSQQTRAFRSRPSRSILRPAA